MQRGGTAAQTSIRTQKTGARPSHVPRATRPWGSASLGRRVPRAGLRCVRPWSRRHCPAPSSHTPTRPHPELAHQTNPPAAAAAAVAQP
eukprot:365010-Chlamydomonas_euryale.AAC.8